MTRLQKRDKILGTDSGIPGILDICISLRCGVNGSCDPLDKKEEKKYIKFLECCLKTWEPSVSPISIVFDGLVYALIKATLEEVKYYNKPVKPIRYSSKD